MSTLFAYYTGRNRTWTVVIICLMEVIFLFDQTGIHSMFMCRYASTSSSLTFPAGVLPLIQAKAYSGLGENLSDTQGGLLTTAYIIASV